MHQDAIREAAALLVDARRTGRPLVALPDSCRPETIDDGLAVMQATIVLLGHRIMAWKVALSPDGVALPGAIMPETVLHSPARLPAARVPLCGVEGEIAFILDRDFPVRAEDYRYEDVASAVTAVVALEIVDTRFADFHKAAAISKLADCSSSGGLVLGLPRADWRKTDLSALEVSITIDGEELLRRVGGHALGDPLLPAVAMINDERLRGGLPAGTVITTGTCSGIHFAKPGQRAVVAFAGFGEAEVTFTA